METCGVRKRLHAGAAGRHAARREPCLIPSNPKNVCTSLQTSHRDSLQVSDELWLRRDSVRPRHSVLPPPPPSPHHQPSALNSSSAQAANGDRSVRADLCLGDPAALIARSPPPHPGGGDSGAARYSRSISFYYAILFLHSFFSQCVFMDSGSHSTHIINSCHPKIK